MDKKGEMEKVAGVFDLYELGETAKAIRGLSNDLYVVCKKVDFEKAFGKIQDVLKVEFISSGSTNPSFRKNLHSALIRLANSATKINPALVRKQIKDFDTSMQRINNSYGVIDDIIRSLVENRKLTIKQHYYAECFGYLLIVEGVFRELCEYILMLDDIRMGRSRNFSEIESLPFFDLVVKEIRSNADISIFADGYHNHLRNAIAHANFRFDETTQKMNFKDEYKGKVTSINLKIEEFGEYYLKIDDLYRLISSIWILGRLVTIYQDC
jgi:hypothetical protein